MMLTRRLAILSDCVSNVQDRKQRTAVEDKRKSIVKVIYRYSNRHERSA
jgi:hypothetical protein